MAQDIIITPRSGEPSIAFTGSGTTASSISLKVLSDSTLSFEGTQGQLFSITDNLTSGVIFGVNDIGGLPLIEASANGNVSLVRYGNNVGIGTGSPAAKLDILETWNTSAVQTGIKLNVIDASSNANSLLVDFQVSGNSLISISKGGLITSRRASQGFRFLGNSDGSSKFYSPSNDFVYQSRIQANGTDIIAFDSARVAINGALQLGYIDANNSNRISLFGTDRTFQIRCNLASPSLQIYNTYTNVSNYERTGLNWNASAFEIQTEASGTGLARNLIIGTSSTSRIFVSSTGQIGIGTSEPQYALHVAASSYPLVFISGTSNDASAQYVFETNGRLRIGATNGTFGEKIRFNNGYSIDTFGGGGIRIKGGAYVTIADNAVFEGAHFSPGYFGSPSLSLRSKFETQCLLELQQQSWNTQTDDYFRIIQLQSGFTKRILTIASSGWMGIGLSAPQATLHVSGNALITNNVSALNYYNTSGALPTTLQELYDVSSTALPAEGYILIYTSGKWVALPPVIDGGSA